MVEHLWLAGPVTYLLLVRIGVKSGLVHRGYFIAMPSESTLHRLKLPKGDVQTTTW